ncbi:MAG TPA: LysM peptidoglycan-binding domain-containing protein [Polyangiales bacterium]
MRAHLHRRYLATAVIWSLLTLWRPFPAHAERQHTVQSGQSLGAIAKHYGVSVADLAAANRLTQEGRLKLGQVLVVPSAGELYVKPGQTLAKIARAHDLDTGELAHANGLPASAALKSGQRLILPGYEEDKERRGAEKKWGAPKHPGTVSLYRIWSKKTASLRLVDTQGHVRPKAVSELRELLRPRLSRKRKDPHPRLLRLIARVSDHFGGRTLHVISGYRLAGGYTRDTSRHVAGEAMDFQIPGVPLSELRDYCQHFDHVGVGYYPRTHFVHLDVRRKDARWTDWSLPGQAPMLMAPGASGAEATDDADLEHLPQHKHEGDIPEPPPAEDDGQPPIDDDSPEPAATK